MNKVLKWFDFWTFWKRSIKINSFYRWFKTISACGFRTGNFPVIKLFQFGVSVTIWFHSQSNNEKKIILREMNPKWKLPRKIYLQLKVTDWSQWKLSIYSALNISSLTTYSLHVFKFFNHEKKLLDHKNIHILCPADFVGSKNVTIIIRATK